MRLEQRRVAGAQLGHAESQPHNARGVSNDDSRSNTQSTRNRQASSAPVTNMKVGAKERSGPTVSPPSHKQPAPTPIKEAKSSGFYSRGGTTPASTGHREQGGAHHRPPSDPSSSDETESSEESSSDPDLRCRRDSSSESSLSRSRDSSSESSLSRSRDSSEESDPTYLPEDAYSLSEGTDSAWGKDPSETISEVTIAVPVSIIWAVPDVENHRTAVRR
ncbi:hypothetical protein DFH09DRAFT_1118678 [Mycena vulgaris]|nr:hypothetical protein DFH09DRAFT_1118678 [Mycena vulgaris]